MPTPARRVTLVRAIALLITLVSILAAVAAWRASVVSGNAGGLDQQASQERIRRQQIEGQLNAQVDQDLRLFPRYLSHLSTWEVLTKRAAQQQDKRPEVAVRLRGDAQEELALARTIYQALSVKPRFGQTEYDEQGSREFLTSFNADLVTLTPDETAKLAEEERSRGVTLVGITALFVSSLFCLTLAQLGRRRIRRAFAVVGVLLMLGASAGMVAVQLA